MDREPDALKDFQTFLSQLGSVPENKITFYVYWVRKWILGRRDFNSDRFGKGNRNSFRVSRDVPF
jgi:hypothetical protein